MPIFDLSNLVQSSFGPFGRSKAIQCSSSGSLIVTKDGHQILQSLLSQNDNRSDDLMQKYLLKLCANLGTKYGNGSSVAVLLMNSFIKLITNQASTLEETKLLRICLETIIHTQAVYDELITTTLVSHSVWEMQTTNCLHVKDDSGTSYIRRLHGFWSELLISSTNIAVAANLLKVLVRFITSLLFVIII